MMSWSYDIFTIGSGTFHKEEINGHVPTSGQRDGVSCR